MLLQFYMLILIVAAGSCFAGIKTRHYLLTLFSTGLFFVLAFASMKVELVSGGVVLNFGDMAIVLLMTLFGGISAILTLRGMLDHLRNNEATDPRAGV